MSEEIRPTRPLPPELESGVPIPLPSKEIARALMEASKQGEHGYILDETGVTRARVHTSATALGYTEQELKQE